MPLPSILTLSVSAVLLELDVTFLLSPHATPHFESSSSPSLSPFPSPFPSPSSTFQACQALLCTICGLKPLMSLLGPILLWSEVSGNIRSISGLAHQPLDGLPGLPCCRWCSLSGCQGIYSSPALRYRGLYEIALAVSSPQERSVDGQEDPAALGEQNGRKEHTEPEEDFQTGDQHHRSVVVAFDKVPDRVGKWG